MLLLQHPMTFNRKKYCRSTSRDGRDKISSRDDSRTGSNSSSRRNSVSLANGGRPVHVIEDQNGDDDGQEDDLETVMKGDMKCLIVQRYELGTYLLLSPLAEPRTSQVLCPVQENFLAAKRWTAYYYRGPLSRQDCSLSSLLQDRPTLKVPFWLQKCSLEIILVIFKIIWRDQCYEVPNFLLSVTLPILCALGRIVRWVKATRLWIGACRILAWMNGDKGNRCNRSKMFEYIRQLLVNTGMS